jgi:hypothetical protein
VVFAAACGGLGSVLLDSAVEMQPLKLNIRKSIASLCTAASEGPLPILLNTMRGGVNSRALNWGRRQDTPAAAWRGAAVLLPRATMGRSARARPLAVRGLKDGPGGPKRWGASNAGAVPSVRPWGARMVEIGIQSRDDKTMGRLGHDESKETAA